MDFSTMTTGILDSLNESLWPAASTTVDADGLALFDEDAANEDDEDMQLLGISNADTDRVPDTLVALQTLRSLVVRAKLAPPGASDSLTAPSLVRNLLELLRTSKNLTLR
jgi:hypothetical protein